MRLFLWRKGIAISNSVSGAIEVKAPKRKFFVGATIWTVVISLAVILTAYVAWPEAVESTVSASSDHAASEPGGISVHGDWTIDVLEDDGRLVSHREFENDLTVYGSRTMAEFLAGDTTPGTWWIILDAAGNDPPCLSSPISDIAVDCRIFEAESGETGAPVFLRNFLNLNVSVTEPDESIVRLSGFIVAGKNGTISDVRTGVGACSPADPPADCTSPTGSSFTLASISGLAVLTNQHVAVTVDLSFS
jgi:hypothetical protein